MMPYARRCPTLLTDLYQLTMAYAHWKTGALEKEGVFHLSFRKHPFESGFSVACGLGDVISYLKEFGFGEDDLDYLRTLHGNDGAPLFSDEFLHYLRRLKLDCDVDALPEGTPVFPNEPILRVKGPLIVTQILETALLNIINFQTLIATKAARVCAAAGDQPVLEFGLRRAQGTDGALAASRAAYLGGCAATSNVLAGKLFDIPVKGTHAHSWVMSFDDERTAFRAYAEAMPNNSTFLVDTYDTIEGVRRAIEVGVWLKEQGHKMTGIRLDSGDLAALSVTARAMLDAAGLDDANILASNDLDEAIIASLKQQGARIDVWGVGTKLVTAYDQPAMGGVYKLGAVRERDGSPWRYCIKLSETAVKISTPGIHQVRRYRHNGHYIGDMIFNIEDGAPVSRLIVDPTDPLKRATFPEEAEARDQLIPIFRRGALVYDAPPLDVSRAFARAQLNRFPAGVKRFLNPHLYQVGLDARLHELRTGLVLKARNNNRAGTAAKLEEQWQG